MSAARWDRRFSGLGHTIVYGSRTPDAAEVAALVKKTGADARAQLPRDAVVDADIVVLAVPGMAVEAVVDGLGDLDGKILLDPTNPLIRDDSGIFRMGVDTSNGEIIQALAPDARVVKAFNTVNWRTMVAPETAGGPVTVPIVGNDEAAKRVVAGLITGLGLEAIDLGSIEHARHVEGMLILWINNRYGEGQAFDFYLRKTGRD